MFTPQITPYTCALACLESFYREHGLSITQETLLRDYSSECFVGRLLDGQDISGALTIHEFVHLCGCLRLQPFAFRDFRRELTIPLIRSVQPRQTFIFFILHFGGGDGPGHSVRFSRMLAPDVFEVMNPSGNPQFVPITWQQFVDWDFFGIRITLPDAKSQP